MSQIELSKIKNGEERVMGKNAGICFIYRSPLSGLSL